MKTTIDLPDALMQRAKITASERGTTLKKLVVEGLEKVLAGGDAVSLGKTETSARLRRDLRKISKRIHKLVVESVGAEGFTIPSVKAKSLARLHHGFHLGGKPLSRDAAHERKRVR